MSEETKQATPRRDLIDQLLDSRIPKSEREHALLVHLRARVAELEAACRALRVAELEKAVEAAYREGFDAGYESSQYRGQRSVNEGWEGSSARAVLEGK